MIRDDLMGIKKELKEVKENQKKGLMFEILNDYKKSNRRMFIIIVIILAMWFVSIGLFIYYINTTGYEEITETAETNDSGNACVGDNCNNGVINDKGN